MNIIAPLIPVLTGAVLWGIFYDAQQDWRSSFLSAAIAWGTYLVAVTEILSLLGAITFRSLVGAWMLGLLLALAWAATSIGDPRKLLAGLHLPDLSPFDIFLLAACALIAALIALIAWIAPPNSYDSMTYHMPRVMHWIQDRSVAYYPTNMLAQIFLTPGGEFFILHFQVLAASDRLANLVQWFCMVGSAVGVSLIARELGSARRGQIFSALAAMTIPIGILQASSTEDNWITAFWLLCFLYWLLRLLKTKADLFIIAALGASLGLAALCKATTYVFALPFLIWLGQSFLRTHREKSAYGFGLIALIFVLVNLGAYTRSYDLFGNPLGMSQEVSIRQPQIDFKYSNDVFSVPQLASNLVRNTALHLSTPFDSVNTILAGVIRSFHGWLGISADDPRTTWAGIKFGLIPLQFNEITDGNLLHLLLGAVGLLLILLNPGRNKILTVYSLCALSGFAIFCFYLKWQPYFSRLHLPLFVLFAPALGTLGSRIDRTWIPKAISVVLLIGAMPWVLWGYSRPLLGPQNILNMSRTSLYFRSKPPVFQKDYSLAVQYVADESQGHCSQVGLYLDHNDYEYPLWVLLAQKTDLPLSVESVQVHNISRRSSSSFPGFTPCAIFVINNLRQGSMQVNGTLYAQAWTSEVFSVFLPK